MSCTLQICSFRIYSLLFSNWLPGYRLKDEIHIITNGAACSVCWFVNSISKCSVSCFVHRPLEWNLMFLFVPVFTLTVLDIIPILWCLCRNLADWLGVEEIGLFNFKPSVRPVPLEVHIQASEVFVPDTPLFDPLLINMHVYKS